MSDTLDLTAELAHRRAVAVAYAKRRSAAMRLLFGKRPREIGSVILQGCRRDVVHAVSAAWVAGERSERMSRVEIPGTSFGVMVGPDRIEVDLDAAGSGDLRAIFSWLRRTVSSRHCIWGTHVIVVYSAHLAELEQISHLASAPNAVLVAATVCPDARSVRDLAGAARMRVPCVDALDVPKCVRESLESLLQGPLEVVDVRKCLHFLRVSGFTVREIIGFARSVMVAGLPVDAPTTELAHVAVMSGLEDRALEGLLVRFVCSCVTRSDGAVWDVSHRHHGRRRQGGICQAGHEGTEHGYGRNDEGNDRGCQDGSAVRIRDTERSDTSLAVEKEGGPGGDQSERECEESCQ